MKIYFLNLLILLLQLLLHLSTIECKSQQQIIQIDQIQIDEELDTNRLILNLTDLLINKLNLIKQNSNLVRLDAIKFDSSQSLLNEYFSIDLKKYRPQSDLSSLDTTNQSSIILLRTSMKKLDREYICRLDSSVFPNNTCSCEDECLLSLSLIAYFALDKPDQIQNEPDTFGLKLKLPILLNDINDNKPFFYQPEILIDLDLIDPNGEKIAQNGLLKIPLKLASDLDSTNKFRVQGYSLENSENFTYLIYSDEKQELELCLDFNKIPDESVNKYFIKKFKLIAQDTLNTATQDITLKYKVSKKDHSNNKQVKSAKSNQIGQGQLVNLIPALNELEIVYKNVSNFYDIKLRNQSTKTQIVFNKSDSLITLAYLIVEKNKLFKIVNQSDLIEIEHDQYVDEPSIQSSLNKNLNLLKINEMRNGLYSISIKSGVYDILKKNSQDLIDYKLKLLIKFNSLQISKLLNIKIPRNLISLLRLNDFSTEFSSTTTTVSMEPLLNSNSTLNLYNSVIIISTASAILVVFGISCLSISIILYLISKCRNKNKKNLETKKIMVYDVLPNGQKTMPIYSLSSSSSSSCGSSNTNNLSPVTTTTTSIVNETSTSPNGPLFETHLQEQPAQKALIYEWFMQNKDETSSSASSNLIKPVSVESSVPTSSITETESTISNVSKYRNDLYRNSQAMFKKQQQQQSSNYYSILNANNTSEIYQAKPINLNLTAQSGTSTPSYSLLNEIQLNTNLNSTDNLRDSIREKMINRLSAALTTTNNNPGHVKGTGLSLSLETASSSNLGQVSCV